MSLTNNEPTKLMSRSKKIQKKKQYENFESSEKELILQAIFQEIMDLFAFDAALESFELADLVSFVDETTLDVSDYNTMILEVIPAQDESFSPTTEQYRKWRKRIRNWTLALDRPDNRGDPNVPKHRLEEFRSGALKILEDMETRNFDALHKNILSLLDEMGLKKSDNVCGKHWWWTYLQQNKDVQRCWSKKKITRVGKKDKEPDEIDAKSPFVHQQMLIRNLDMYGEDEGQNENDESVFGENLEIGTEADLEQADQFEAEEIEENNSLGFLSPSVFFNSDFGDSSGSPDSNSQGHE